MVLASILCVQLLYLGFTGGQDPIGGEDGSNCCPLISVQGDIQDANLVGQYSLKYKQGFKPEDVCINGCIYIKRGSSSSAEYCFRLGGQVGADVQCLAGSFGTTENKNKNSCWNNYS